MDSRAARLRSSPPQLGPYAGPPPPLFAEHGSSSAENPFTGAGDVEGFGDGPPPRTVTLWAPVKLDPTTRSTMLPRPASYWRTELGTAAARVCDDCTRCAPYRTIVCVYVFASASPVETTLNPALRNASAARDAAPLTPVPLSTRTGTRDAGTIRFALGLPVGVGAATGEPALISLNSRSAAGRSSGSTNTAAALP